VLFGGPRIGANGWKPELYDKAGEPQHNQAHHLAMFIILGINHGRTLSRIEAEVLDGLSLLGSKRNDNDILLSKIGSEIGRMIIRNELNLKNLEDYIIKQIESP
jgi:hypothetical protein